VLRGGATASAGDCAQAVTVPIHASEDLESAPEGSQAHRAPPPVSLFDAKGAAALLNVPTSWVLAEARADRIPHVRLGRYVRFDASELEKWWLSRRRGPWRPRGKAAAAARRRRSVGASGVN
jgi:excisionase family DNA binding protein